MTMPTVSPGGAPPRSGWRRNTIVWLIAGVFGAYVVTNGVMLFVAMRSPPMLVSKSYYEDSRRYDAVQSAEQASAAAGWRVEALPPGPAAVVVSILDPAGRPASGFSGAVNAYRPNDPALDQALAWSEDPRSPGQYQATFARPRAGQWRIQLALRRGGERLDHEMRIVCP